MKSTSSPTPRLICWEVWTWVLTKPGRTYLPFSSMTSASGFTRAGSTLPTATILSSSTSTPPPSYTVSLASMERT